MRLIYGALVVLSLAGCASAVSSGYGQGGQNSDGRSYAEARADNKITAAVNAALIRDSVVPAMDVDVRTYDGVVTLAGYVPSAEVARRAGRIAAAVPGVVQVENRLNVSR